MSNIQYKIWKWGGTTGEGSNEQYNVAVCTKAKRSKRNKYELANEWLCMKLGQALNLPIPAGGILTKDGHQYFASLEFALAPQRLPPCTEQNCAEIAAQNWLACGIVAFDAWVVNEDREKANIVYLRSTGDVYLIDHGNSPFWDSHSTKAVDYLKGIETQLVISHENHCIARHVTTLNDLSNWYERIKQIPEYFIRESMEQAGELGLTADQISFGTDFLLDRRDRLKVLFANEYRTAFPKLNPQRDLFVKNPFDVSTEINYCI